MVKAIFEQGTVVGHEALSPSIVRTTILSPGIAAEAAPGQFVNIKCTPSISYDPLLPRPFSYNRIDRVRGTFAVLYRVVGRGTELLRSYRIGDKLTTLGPLGKGFVPPELSPSTVAAKKKILIVAGGMGIAPFYPLAESLLIGGFAVKLLYGTRSAVDLADRDELAHLGADILCCTEDLDFGHSGLVTDLLQTTLGAGECFDVAYACGPRGMLSAVKRVCQSFHLPLQLSLEEHMACGLGVCLGCTCERASGEGYWHVCTDGPVIWAEEVDLG